MWFVVVRIPVLKIAVGDSVLRFAPVEEGMYLWGQREFPYRCLKVVQQARGVLEVTRYAYARLYNYFTGEELPIEVRTTNAEYALPGWRERARHVPVLFKILLEDPQWRKEKVVRAHALLEVYSARGEVNSCVCAREEWVELGGKKFTRTLGLFSTANDPFVCEEG
jgi:hypothetical protein